MSLICPGPNIPTAIDTFQPEIRSSGGFRRILARAWRTLRLGQVRIPLAAPDGAVQIPLAAFRYPVRNRIHIPIHSTFRKLHPGSGRFFISPFPAMSAPREQTETLL